ncbi:hypothetical protein ABIC10_004810 [Bradyrhizobium sp. S3.2.12]
MARSPTVGFYHAKPAAADAVTRHLLGKVLESVSRSGCKYPAATK